MRALVTGGAGFIGAHLSERLMARGHQVISLDDLSTGSAVNITNLASRHGFEFQHGSVLDAPLIDDLVARVDAVFHLAAAVGVRLILTRSLDGLRTNIHGTEIVLDSAQRHRVPTLITSTSEVYGKNSSAALSEDEDRVIGSPLTKRWSYAEAKALDETLAYLYWRERAAATVIVRLFNVAGPRQSGRYGMVIPRFVDQALRGEPLTVYGDGRQTRSFCHVSDAVDGLVALMDQPAAYGGVFNLGRPEEISIQHLAERVIARSGSDSSIRHIPYWEAYGDGYEDTLRRVPDISRARKLVGFDPRLGLDEIIDSVIDVHPASVQGVAVRRSSTPPRQEVGRVR
jgi:UDP-glucose 4-epimerase